MHELGLSEGVLSVALQAAGGERVERVRLRVGRLQRVVPESMEMAWHLVSEQTVAAGSRLEMVEVPLQLRCRCCGREGQAEDLPLCPDCGSTDVEVRDGDRIEVLEVELAGGQVRRNPAAATATEKER
jgi:hydrogenase nickel incorporation protein HypA/HybF